MHAAAQASTLATVPEILAGIDSLFRRALSLTRAQVNKAADANQALDHCQVQGYEFAMINAELHAATAIIDYARSSMTEPGGVAHGAAFESHLAGAFVAGGHEPQKQQWLPGIATGKPIVAIAVTEPDCGSDVAAVRLRASPTPGGLVLNGAKTCCTFAGKAGLLMVLARSDADPAAGHRGLTLFLLEKPPTDEKAFEFRQTSGDPLRAGPVASLARRWPTIN